MVAPPAQPSEENSAEPERKRPKTGRQDGTLDRWRGDIADQNEFLKDVVAAFVASNVPLSKLDAGSPM